MTNVRDAVVAANNAAVEDAAAPLPELVRQAVERQHEVLQAILPKLMNRERFEAITLAAVKASPKLVQCFGTLEGRTSVIYGVIQAASVGLEINTIGQEAHLIPREVKYQPDNPNQKGPWPKRWEASLQLGYRGVQKVANRDPRVKQVFAEVVREGDHFVHRRGLEEDQFEHEIIGPSDRPLTHAYAVIRWHEAPAFVRVLDRQQVEARRDVSTAYKFAEGPKGNKDSIWHKWPAEQWRKTAMHSITRELDLNPQIERTLASDDEPIILDSKTGELLPARPAIEAATEPTGDAALPDPGNDAEAPVAPPPEDQNAAAAEESPETLPTAGELRKLIVGPRRGAMIEKEVKNAVDAVCKQFEAAAGTLDDVAGDPEAVKWLLGWIERRDAK